MTPQLLASVVEAVGGEDRTTDLPEELLASSTACLAPATASAAPSPAAAGSPSRPPPSSASRSKPRSYCFDDEASTSPRLLPLRRRKLACGEAAAQRSHSSHPPRRRIVLLLHLAPSPVISSSPPSQAALLAISPRASSYFSIRAFWRLDLSDLARDLHAPWPFPPAAPPDPWRIPWDPRPDPAAIEFISCPVDYFQQLH